MSRIIFPIVRRFRFAKKAFVSSAEIRVFFPAYSISVNKGNQEDTESAVRKTLDEAFQWKI